MQHWKDTFILFQTNLNSCKSDERCESYRHLNKRKSVSISQLSTCKLLRWTCTCKQTLTASYLAYGSRSLNTIICFYPDPIRFLYGSCRLENFQDESASYIRPYLVPNWHLDPEVNIQKYVSTRILSSFYKTVVYL